jgi:Tol biopolymer transport system component
MLLIPSMFSCNTLKPAEFNVYTIEVNPPEVAPSEIVTVTATIVNSGGVADNYTAILNVDGKERARQIVSIKPSDNATVSFSLNEPNVGRHDVALGTESDNFTVYETSRYLLRNDNGTCSDSYCLYDPRGQWVKLIPPSFPFKIDKIYVQGKRSSFNNPESKIYTIKIWDKDFKKELYSKDYPYSNYSTSIKLIEHQIDPPIVVTDSFIIDFISHGESNSNVAMYTCVDFTVDSSQNNGASWIGTDDSLIRQQAISSDSRWARASWVIQSDGTCKKTAGTNYGLKGGSQNMVYLDRLGESKLLSLDGTQNKYSSYVRDRSPDGKTIVFEKQTDFGNTWLYLKDSDGQNIRPILPIMGAGPFYQFPAWSPDGSKIAFCKSRPNNGSSRFVAYDIWIMNPDGSEIKKISDTTPPSNPRTNVMPRWFPDNKRLAYASNESGWWEIYSAPIDHYESSLIVRLNQKFEAGYVPWDYQISPDGNRMIYRDGQGTDVKTRIIDLNTNHIVEWPNIDVSKIAPITSADGTVTVITKSDGLYYTDNSHNEPTKIPNTSAGDIAIKVE